MSCRWLVRHRDLEDHVPSDNDFDIDDDSFEISQSEIGEGALCSSDNDYMRSYVRTL